MKTGKLLLSALCVAMLCFTSCKDDDDDEEMATLIVSDLEVGENDSRKGYIGKDLHLEAQIVADGKIATISVEIHNEDGSGDEIEAEYTDYAGQLNATLHKHIDIPADVAAGEYHLHLTVVDQAGNSATVEAELEIEASEG